MSHITVLLDEAVAALAVKPDGIYVDATFGRGGHSRLILTKLGQTGRLIALDKDLDAVNAGEILAATDKRFKIVHSGFKDLNKVLKELGIEQIDGILFDLGLSSPQIDVGARGFSIRHDAPLDMRMNTLQGISAFEWINQVDESDLAWVLKHYGDERFYRKIARAIVEYRQQKPLQTTHQLANLISDVVKFREGAQHPAIRSFQAIRIEINQELKEIELALADVLKVLKTGGRLVVIAFHSLEDRIVKQFIKRNSTAAVLPKWVMIKDEPGTEPLLKAIGKPIRPTQQEVQQNNRARSAIMRVAQRTRGSIKSE